jgi:hypothetical protein
MVYESGEVCMFPAGGPIEADLVESIVKEVMANGVAFKTKSHIEKDVRCGIEKAMFEFKKQSLVLINPQNKNK